MSAQHFTKGGWPPAILRYFAVDVHGSRYVNRVQVFDELFGIVNGMLIRFCYARYGTAENFSPFLDCRNGVAFNGGNTVEVGLFSFRLKFARHFYLLVAT